MKGVIYLILLILLIFNVSNSFADKRIYIVKVEVGTKSEAEGILSRLKSGEPFDKIVGKEGYIEEINWNDLRRDLRTEFKKALEGLKEGDYTKIVSVDSNYAILYIVPKAQADEIEKAIIEAAAKAERANKEKTQDRQKEIDILNHEVWLCTENTGYGKDTLRDILTKCKKKMDTCNKLVKSKKLSQNKLKEVKKSLEYIKSDYVIFSYMLKQRNKYPGEYQKDFDYCLLSPSVSCWERLPFSVRRSFMQELEYAYVQAVIAEYNEAAAFDEPYFSYELDPSPLRASIERRIVAYEIVAYTSDYKWYRPIQRLFFLNGMLKDCNALRKWIRILKHIASLNAEEVKEKNIRLIGDCSLE